MRIRVFTTMAASLFLLGLPVHAQMPSGPFLAAQQARYQADFAAAAQYYAQALMLDPSNPSLLENATIAYIALGQFDRALAIAHKMEADGLNSQMARMTLIAEETRKGSFDALQARLKQDRGLGALADGLLAAWAHVGQGNVTAALEQFDKVAKMRGMQTFAIYHKALALASVGDFEGADKVFSGEASGPMQRTRRGIIGWSQVLSQIDQQERALALIDETFGKDIDPEIKALRDALEAKEKIPFSLATNPAEGIAEVFYALGRGLMQEASDEYVLMYSRTAESIRADHVDAILLSATLLERVERHDLAIETYKRVPRDNPAFHNAELGRSDALRRAGKTDAAAEVLEQLVKSHPDLPDVHAALGDLFRSEENFAKAAAAYDRAIDLYRERGSDQWFAHYARAICHERLDNWDKAEADFRRALELDPENPQVLNYLGYSMVEKHINLDEALGMIERAVAAQPDSGYIVDSLGWVLFRLGRYDEAITHMERAAELMPVDPVVNDHLGDVLWAVGRKVEARFQWKRAISLNQSNPSGDIDFERVKRKLEVGLDQVLDDEGSEPLKVVNDGG